MALVDMGAETSVIHGDLTKLNSNRVMIGGFGGTDHSGHPNMVEIGGWAKIGQRCISVRAVQAILRGHVKHEPICLPKLHQITNVRQYRFPGGQDEISSTVQELEEVGIVRPACNPYISSIWPVRKPDGTWKMTVY